ncbi:SDR family oxidoreductase [Paenibacillus monticola]|uniref:NAD(P)H-binding protein n=1 Tax=Paenibacillus monticola TaxID=2666075 RepID=A0A7X2H9T0_9BACL|nr:SDR family oxidoreductase [Paenibacillus monticola]MRN56171.1 NAD(P)H-binding protein [Paenibacillus monticola]
MSNILVTGFTGNTGQEVAKKLKVKNASILCAVRHPENALKKYGEQNYVHLDYSRHETFEPALLGIDRIFLMYPPETLLSDFHAFIHKSQEIGIRHIVYLSVKDAQRLPFIPHFKNERAIARSGIPYTFLRAGYFMQNLNLFMLDEIIKNDRIYVPAGRGKTSFTDVRDIAEIAARSLTESAAHLGKKYALTGSQAIDFYEVARTMTTIIGRPISYSQPSTQEFKTYMLAKGLESKYINVVSGIHFITKIGLAKGITDVYSNITHKQPTGIETYIKDYQASFTPEESIS